MNTDDLFGMPSGAAGEPAILANVNQALASERVCTAYATIFPSISILKIIGAQVATALLAR